MTLQPTIDFIHLRVQSSYSLLASTIKIPSLVGLAKKNNMKSVAVTDKTNLFASLEFSMEASKNRVAPIHGFLIDLLYDGKEKSFGEILIIAKDEIGFKNLLKLSSFPYIKNPRLDREHITLEDLEKYNEGLIILSGYTDGPCGIELLKKNEEKAKDLADYFLNLFGDRFYFEIFRHNLDDEKRIEVKYLELASTLNIPLVATNKVLFEDIKMHDAHDVLLCIEAGVVKENMNRKFASNQCYFKSQEEMTELFKDLPSSIINSGNIAKRCSVRALEKDPILPNFTENNGAEGASSEEATLRLLSEEGLKKRLAHKFKVENITDNQEQISRKYFDRLEYELSVVTKMNFSGYFLIVSDFIIWSKQNSINVGPGRGSGAGSIIAWSLLITDLDPIRFGLLFERFLNPERVSMPDFDIDFCQERREEVIRYVRQKYGDNRVAQIITFGKLQAKAAIKDVARVLGLRYDTADYLTELVPFNAVNPVTLEQALRDVAELKLAYNGEGLYDNKNDNELIKQVLDTSLILEGLNRHCSVHAAGIVISGLDLVEMLPVYKDINGEMNIIQYSMKYAEAAGLVKFDFLGLQTLTVISKCLELLKKSGVEVDLSSISFKDPKSYEMLSLGESVGVFQFESPGMKDTLRKLKPDCIEDLMALGALYRPGPMDNIPTYIACKHGKQKPDYLHPLLQPLLEETYGVIVYQEQVLEIAKVLAGYSLGAADLLRRAMGKKIKAEMDAQEKLFTEGAEKNGIPKDQAKEIFAAVAKFAGYGFNRAHAASYGVISYYTAYLKANYPVEFLVACLNLDINDYDKISLFKEEAKSLGIEFLPPNINKSSGLFTILNQNGIKSILYGLGAIRNVTINFGDEIAAKRLKDGDFNSITSFMEKLAGKNLSKRSLESLIKAGAFDVINRNRKQLLQSVPALLAHSSRHTQDMHMQQVNLFGAKSKVDDLVATDDYSDHEKGFMELEVLGLFANFHPLSMQEKRFKESGITHISKLKEEVIFGSQSLKIAGIIIKKDARMSPRGRFVTMQLSDPSGNCDLTIYSENVLREYSSLLANKTAIIAQCDSFRDEGGIRLTATKFFDANSFFKNGINNFKIKAKNDSELDLVVSIMLERQHSENDEIDIEGTVGFDNFQAKFKFKSKHNLSDADYSKIKHLIM